MYLWVTVAAGETSARFRVPCGDGRKTFKWLGLVAAGRYCGEAPRGAARAREAPQSKAAGTALFPQNVSADGVDFFHPDALVSEELPDGAEVRIDLAARIGVGAAGKPNQSRWATIAFDVSEPRSPHRQRALDNEYDAQEAKRVSQLAHDDAERQKDVNAKAKSMRFIVATQLPDSTQVREALHEDWFAMAAVLDKVVPNRDDQRRCKGVLAQHFVLLNELYRAFLPPPASVLVPVQRMDFGDLCELASATGFLPAAALRQCFDECLGNFAPPDGKAAPAESKAARGAPVEGKVDRASFLNMLIWSALFSGWPSADAAPLGDGAAQPASAGTAAPIFCAGDAPRLLERLILDRLVPGLDRRAPQSAGRAALATDDVLATLWDAEAALRGIFDRGARAEELSLAEFQQFVEDAGLGGGRSISGVVSRASHADLADAAVFAGLCAVTVKDVRNAFLNAQGDVSFLAPELKRARAIRLKQALAEKQPRPATFGEFLEAVVRLALVKWGDAKNQIPHAERVRRGLYCVLAKLQPNFLDNPHK
ncbi:hypothetical protein M885DRAFT_509311 [Pelagophyceae sp. CCMP2097]|nr:hypothetical protein M885DRAFT_509311 [Pelagophyceae sp. CCMP2097]